MGHIQEAIATTTFSWRQPDWGPATETQEDNTPPVLAVPEDMVVEAVTSAGAEINYTVTAEDNVDGTATLEEDGRTVTQDDVGGNIAMSCEPASGSTFPVGETEGQCSATDAVWQYCDSIIYRNSKSTHTFSSRTFL